ncbi:MAG TPA: hypothetical protein DCE41_08810 [Cytophagales bacterium]|nr:hypothetical protein [Cytophagales bacterium]HAA20163.1 hypothetical protein [Cytophagales bacterium]HAP59710.1 hypothetical protein [Cytophagales bacterium]
MKKVIALFALVGFATTSFAAANSKINHTKENFAPVKVQRTLTEVAELMGTEEAELEYFFGLEEEGQTVKVYNAQDELIAEGTVDFAGMAQDPELAEAMLNASRLMTIGNTDIYRTDN